MSKKIAIIGSGNVGKALLSAIERTSYEVRAGGRGEMAENAGWADIIMLAVPYSAVKEVANEVRGAADGKAVIDVTNALNSGMQLAIGFSTSGAEELQKVLPKAHVVKAFNTLFAQQMSGGGAVAGQQLSAFSAGDNDAARKMVLDLAKALGFDAIDAGPLKNARHLEAMAAFNIQLGFVLGYGPNVGFKFVH